MNKPSVVILQFNKSEDFTLSQILRIFEKKSVRVLQEGTGGDALVAVDVNGFSLDDHQFIQIKARIVGKVEALLWIPRGFVKMISEGKGDLGQAFSFAAAAKSSGPAGEATS
jgi:hypothetical protein